jgi:hypothetical protein
MIKPFWVMLGLDVIEQEVTILGFNNKSRKEALTEARNRSDNFVSVFDMSSSATIIRKEMFEWFRNYRITELEANRIIREVAKSILEKCF